MAQGKEKYTNEVCEKSNRKTSIVRYTVSSTCCNGTAAGIADHIAKGSKSSIGNPAKSTYCKR